MSRSRWISSGRSILNEKSELDKRVTVSNNSCKGGITVQNTGNAHKPFPLRSLLAKAARLYTVETTTSEESPFSIVCGPVSLLHPVPRSDAQRPQTSKVHSSKLLMIPY